MLNVAATNRSGAGFGLFIRIDPETLAMTSRYSERKFDPSSLKLVVGCIQILLILNFVILFFNRYTLAEIIEDPRKRALISRFWYKKMSFALQKWNASRVILRRCNNCHYQLRRAAEQQVERNKSF